MKQLLQFMRVDKDMKRSRSSIWFLDKYGQPRFLDLQGIWHERSAIELLAEIERLFLSHDKGAV